jgi:hypothetical protein
MKRKKPTWESRAFPRQRHPTPVGIAPHPVPFLIPSFSSFLLPGLSVPAGHPSSPPSSPSSLPTACPFPSGPCATGSSTVRRGHLHVGGDPWERVGRSRRMKGKFQPRQKQTPAPSLPPSLPFYFFPQPSPPFFPPPPPLAFARSIPPLDAVSARQGSQEFVLLLVRLEATMAQFGAEGGRERGRNVG